MTSAPDPGAWQRAFGDPRRRRFVLARIGGYGAAVPVVLTVGLEAYGERAVALALVMAVAGATSLVGRHGRGMPLWVGTDLAVVSVALIAADLPTPFGSLLWAAHLASAFLTLPRRTSWLLAAWAACMVVVTYVVDMPLAAEPSTTIEVIFLLVGFGMILSDLDLLAGAWRRMQAESEREATRQREAADNRTRVLRSVSHDLRGPLTAIRGFADLLGEEGLDEIDRAAFTSHIRSEAIHLEHLVDDLLAAARLEAGALVIDTHAVEVGDVVGGLAARSAAAGIPLDVTVPDDAVVLADAGRLGQILRNLVSNAVKYGAEPIGIEATVEADVVTIAVTDHGPGIPVGDLDRLFGDFEQGSGASSGTGTGLGLGIARRLARAMSGDLVAVPTDVGARFDLTLPVAPPARAGTGGLRRAG